ncbi:MAG TPA: hypothetical protein GX708_24695 [Gallicola sp.]|nr:hypothetical protein [Gallicola sp.]
MKNYLEKQEWLLKYIKKNRYVDVLNMEFVDSFILEFNPKHEVMPYGANRCKELGRLLSSLYNQGILDRQAQGISEGEGFPKYVYVYKLTELGKRMC